MIVCFYTMLKLKNDRLHFYLLFVYTFSAYRATDVFYRGAMGEAVSLTLLPMVFLGTYYVLFNDYKKWYWLAIGMTLLVYTYLLSVIMCSIDIGFLFVYLFFKRENLSVYDISRKYLLEDLYHQLLNILLCFNINDRIVHGK